MEKVGIIIPCYNAGNYIEESINSCLDQFYKNIAVIVIDDCSTDKWEYTDTDGRVYFARNKMNLGASETRNIGAKHATSLGCDYLLFHDADDVMTKDSITSRIDLIREPLVSVVYGDYYNMDEDGKIVSYENKPDFSFQRLLEDNYISCLSLTKTIFFNTVGGFDSHLTFGEDWDLWLRILKFGVAVHVHNPVFCYRMNPDSQTRTIDWDLYAMDMKIISAKQRLFRGEIAPEELMPLYNKKILYRNSNKGAMNE